MRKLDLVVVHCTATRPEWWKTRTLNQKVAEVKRWHVEENGWRDIGYHYLIDRDGKVAKGRHVAQVGAHCRGFNKTSIGIALFGGHGSAETDKFSEHFMPEQDDALRRLIKSLQEHHGDMAIIGHNEKAAKACPGFNVQEWLTGHRPAPPAPETKSDNLGRVIAAVLGGLAALIASFWNQLFGG